MRRSAAEVNPGAVEVCNAIDDDCDELTDDDESLDRSTGTYSYIDNDGDGVGSASAFVQTRVRPPGYSGLGNDCDDENSYTYPGAPELCDGVDNDCDKTIDEDLVDLNCTSTATRWFWVSRG